MENGKPVWHVRVLGTDGRVYKSFMRGLYTEEKARETAEANDERDLAIVIVHPGKIVEVFKGDINSLKEHLDGEFPGWTLKSNR